MKERIVHDLEVSVRIFAASFTASGDIPSRPGLFRAFIVQANLNSYSVNSGIYFAAISSYFTLGCLEKNASMKPHAISDVNMGRCPIHLRPTQLNYFSILVNYLTNSYCTCFRKMIQTVLKALYEVTRRFN